MQIEKLKAAYEKGYRIINNKVVNTRTGKVRKTFYYKHYQGLIRYPYFTIRYEKKPVSIWAHQLAAFQKYGEKKCSQNNVVVRHRKNNILDFSKENILLGTQTDNIRDQDPEMRQAKAEKASQAAAAKIRFNKHRYEVLEYVEDF